MCYVSAFFFHLVEKWAESYHSMHHSVMFYSTFVCTVSVTKFALQEICALFAHYMGLKNKVQKLESQNILAGYHLVCAYIVLLLTACPV